jgi:hypothetical protein
MKKMSKIVSMKEKVTQSVPVMSVCSWSVEGSGDSSLTWLP